MTVKVRVTKEMAIELLKKKARTRPDRVAKALYVKDNKPVCIVGDILVRDLKVPANGLNQDIFADKGWDYGISSDEFRRYLRENFGVGFTTGAVKVLARAQDWQDNGATWREAVDGAVKVKEYWDYV